jgi:pimeloyl-ACP methyl ester carboxylesterase
VSVRRDHARRRAKALAAFLAVGFLFASPSFAEAITPSSVYAAPQKLVPVEGGRRLNLYCEGSGSPAVVLDAGAGGTMMVWRHVQAEIAKFTRVCAYDRAGLGFSDAATRPSDIRNMVDDLRRLVLAGRIQMPFVYIGHSLAGMVGVLYVATYPDDVAGAVLVDPSFAGQIEAMQAAAPLARRNVVAEALDQQLKSMRDCLELARKGELTDPRTPEAHRCADPGEPDAVSDDVLLRAMAKVQAQASVWEAQISEIENFAPRGDQPNVDTAELDGTSPSFGDKPLAVLTAGVAVGAPEQVAAWRAGHDGIAALSTRGDNTIVAGARHYIQIDRPQAVIDAVRRVVAVVRLR